MIKASVLIWSFVSPLPTILGILPSIPGLVLSILNKFEYGCNTSFYNYYRIWFIEIFLFTNSETQSFYKRWYRCYYFKNLFLYYRILYIKFKHFIQILKEISKSLNELTNTDALKMKDTDIQKGRVFIGRWILAEPIDLLRWFSTLSLCLQHLLIPLPVQLLSSSKRNVFSHHLNKINTHRDFE